MLFLYLFFHISPFIIHRLFVGFFRRDARRFGRRKPTNQSSTAYYCFTKKPEWVRKEVIHTKALMPRKGCRKLADSFNRRFAHKNVTVSKSYVNEVVRKHQYEIQILRKKIKHRRPRPVPLNQVWAVDLTGKQDARGQTHQILGLLEHGSRASLGLHGLKDKTSVTLLRHLLGAIEQYGKPKFLRTDNEAVFTSRLFRFGLWALGIKHQRTDMGCPWMNGRVERFFGTLKAKLDHWDVDSLEQLNAALVPFRFWYNHVRPHQYLGGRTPAEVWSGQDSFTTMAKREFWFEAWDGLLTGYYLRL